MVPARIEERRLDVEPIEPCVRRLAEAKAMAVSSRLPAPVPCVLGADTAVVLEDTMMGKPRDRESAIRMLLALSGREHEVFSAVALAQGGQVRSVLSRSRVRLRRLEQADCERYWDGGEPRGKAGGYAIQGWAAIFIEHLEGSYSGVVGLPLYETAQLLAAAGVRLWQA